MYQKLLKVVQEHDRLSSLMSTQEIATNPKKYAELAKAQRQISDVVSCFRSYQEDEKRLKEAETILYEEDDPELRELAAQAAVYATRARGPGTRSQGSSTPIHRANRSIAGTTIVPPPLPNKPFAKPVTRPIAVRLHFFVKTAAPFRP